ncbi:MAG TPA: hypothetical protein VFZ16_23050 [Hyphomicrobiaceae bacterium]|nr:hypothetical protein [Hyphomicrobiaceae bacterium]
MQDLNKALADIGSIRQQLAAGTMFRGFGPAVVAATGLLAAATTIAQSLWLGDPSRHAIEFFAQWTITAVVGVALIGAEMIARTRRHHAGLADAMLHNAVEQSLPAGIAGAATGVVLMLLAPEVLWLLPGLWQIFLGLGIFASVRSLPRAVALAGIWYVAAGVVVLALSSQTQALSPWTMGLPFVVGQMMLGAILHQAFGGVDDEDAG